MEKWEYLTATIGYTQTNEPKIKAVDGKAIPEWKTVPFRHALRILGEDGWELVTASSPDAYGQTQDPLYVFKRPWLGAAYDFNSFLARLGTLKGT